MTAHAQCQAVEAFTRGGASLMGPLKVRTLLFQIKDLNR